MSEHESKHTRGPWVYCADNDANGKPGFRVYSEGEALPYLNPVAFVPMEGRGWEQAEANALLFAEAPDLLAACKEAMAFLDGQGYDFRHCHEHGWDIRETISAAIARAEGGSVES